MISASFENFEYSAGALSDRNTARRMPPQGRTVLLVRPHGLRPYRRPGVLCVSEALCGGKTQGSRRNRDRCRPGGKRMTSRRKPDIEAVSVKVKADEVRDEGYFHARNTHGGNRMTASGRVKITVTKQHKDSGGYGQTSVSRNRFFGPRIGQRACRDRGSRCPCHQEKRRGRKIN